MCFLIGQWQNVDILTFKVVEKFIDTSNQKLFRNICTYPAIIIPDIVVVVNAVVIEIVDCWHNNVIFVVIVKNIAEVAIPETSVHHFLYYSYFTGRQYQFNSTLLYKGIFFTVFFLIEKYIFSIRKVFR